MFHFQILFQKSHFPHVLQLNIGVFIKAINALFNEYFRSTVYNEYFFKKENKYNIISMVYTNQKFVRIMSCTKENIVGNTLWSLIKT